MDTPTLPMPLSETPEPLRICSKALRSCLIEGGDYRAAVQAICSSPALWNETKDLVAQIEEAARPATEIEIFQIVAEMMPHFGIRDLTPEHNAALMEPYLDVLKEFPEGVLRAAKLAWMKGELYPNDIGRHAFMPKAVELKKLADPRVEKIRKAAYRAREAIKQRPAGPRPDKTPEEKAKVAAILAEFQSGAANPLSDPPKPSVSRHTVADRLRRAAEAGR